MENHANLEKQTVCNKFTIKNLDLFYDNFQALIDINMNIPQY